MVSLSTSIPLKEFHEPCSGLSRHKVAQKGAEAVDPKEFVKDWVQTVDTVHTELEAESRKIFGNDQEFFHVQQDPNSIPGFRDSGYYDGSIVDMRSSLDGKSGLKALDAAMTVTAAEKQVMLDEMLVSDTASRKSKQSSVERSLMKASLGRLSVEREFDRRSQSPAERELNRSTDSTNFIQEKKCPSVERVVDKSKINLVETVEGQDSNTKPVDTKPADIANNAKQNQDSCDVQTPSSVGNDFSFSDSEYQSVPPTPDVETLGEFGAPSADGQEQGNDEHIDMEKSAESCAVS